MAPKSDVVHVRAETAPQAGPQIPNLYPLQQLPPDHGAYNAAFLPKVQPGLMGISNGVRMLAIHAPREVSLGLQMGPTEAYQPWFELASNILFQATDKVPVASVPIRLPMT